MSCNAGERLKVRLHFQERPWDLYLAFGFTVCLSSFLILSSQGNFLAIVLVMFVPGYVLMAALFPASSVAARPEFDWIERVALSFGSSICVVPLLGLVLNYTPWGIRLTPVVVSVASFTAVAGFVAYFRRMHLPVEKRLSATLEFDIRGWIRYGSLDKGLTIILAASIVFAAVTLAFFALIPRPGDQFTEFYVLGPGGNASGYPTSLNVSQAGSVILAIANHESAGVNYTVRIDLVGVQLVANATSGYNETVELNRTTWSTFRVILANGENWTQQYTFRIDAPGLWKLQFLLFKDGDFSSSYRELHLYVRVS